MNGRFIYVFDDDARDKLLSAGFSMLHADNTNHAYVFAANSKLSFSFEEISYVATDTLTYPHT